MAGWEGRFGDYVGRLGDVLGHADRRAPLRAYATGLLLPGERKSVEPMAARLDPGRVGAAHQSLHHFVAKAAWDDAALLGAVRDYALPAMLERGPVRARLGPAAQAVAPRRGPPAARGRGAGGGPARGRVAERHLARGHGRRAELALRGGAGPAGARRLPPQRAARRGVAAGGVARGREGADEVLAPDLARGGDPRGAGRDREAALAHRARLRGAEAGARVGALRGPRLARLPPPRLLVRRGLRVPGGRALPLFPSGLATRARGPRAAGRLPPPRLLPCARSGTTRSRSRPCAGTSRWRCCAGCPDAPAACGPASHRPCPPAYDTVVLRAQPRKRRGEQQ